MANLKDLRKRIASVGQTQKITSAMKMVAAAKLRRAQDAAEAGRPYADRIEGVLAALARAARNGGNGPKLLLGTGREDTHLLIVATAERGLCGAFNSSIVRLARARIAALEAEGKTVKILCVGRKGRDQLRRLHGHLILDTIDMRGVRRLAFADIEPIAERILALFGEEAFDVCSIFYSRFVTVMTQRPTERLLIPAPVPEESEEAETFWGGASHEYEPDEAEILAEILPRNLRVQLFRALLENAASEQGARMTAMENATRNAGEMIDGLTLTYNRTRQAVITKELIEIISGAEAL